MLALWFMTVSLNLNTVIAPVEYCNTNEGELNRVRRDLKP